MIFCFQNSRTEHYQYTCKPAVILGLLKCLVTGVLQTSGTGCIHMSPNDRQRVAGGDWVTA